MKRIIAIAALVGLSGCAQDFATTNQMIADSNANRLEAYGRAMVACNGDNGCQIGVSMAFATRAGEQELVRPERTSEILSAVVPLASLGLQAWGTFYGGGPSGTGSAGYVITGDNNTLSGIGNALEASGGSTLSAPFSSSNNFSWSNYNRDYSIGGTAGEITGEGLVDEYPLETTVEDSTGETVEVTAD